MQVNQTLSSWLLRSYIDLRPTPCKGIFHPHGVDHAFRVMTHGDAPPPLQVSLPRALRTALLRKAGRARLDVDDPLRVPYAERSPGWHLLCDYLNALDHLAAQDIVAAVHVVSRLCMYAGVLLYAPQPKAQAMSQDESWAQVAWLRAHAAYMVQEEADETPVDGALRAVVAYAPRGGVAQLNALHQLCLRSVRHGGNPAALAAWVAQSETALMGVEDRLMPTQAAILRSRVHRMAALAAQLDDRLDAAHASLNRAEAYVHACGPRTPQEELAQSEALAAILEARSQRAVALQDAALAERYLRQLTELCPLDGRARLLYGEALLARGNVLSAMSEYRWATRLAPPDEEIAWFMLGQCHERLGHNDAAFDAYLNALALAPGNPAAARRMRALVKGLVPMGMAVWARAQDALLQRAAKRRVRSRRRLRPGVGHPLSPVPAP